MAPVKEQLIDRLRDPLARSGVPMSEPQLQKLVADHAEFPRYTAAFGIDHGFQSIVFRTRRKCWYY